jgi:hypothetical protein
MIESKTNEGDLEMIKHGNCIILYVETREQALNQLKNIEVETCEIYQDKNFVRVIATI